MLNNYYETGNFEKKKEEAIKLDIKKSYGGVSFKSLNEIERFTNAIEPDQQRGPSESPL